MESFLLSSILFGILGGFVRARAFRRSEAEAASSVQNMFEQSYIIPQASLVPV